MLRRIASVPGLAALGIALLSASSAAARGDGADGRFDTRTSSHFVLRQDVDIDKYSGVRGSRSFEQRILELLERGYDDIDARLGMRPRQRITVVIYDPSDFDRRFSGLFRFPAAGFYGDAIHIRGATVVTRQLVRVLNHELVHAAFHAEAPRLALPAWFNEGVAEWFEARSIGKRRLSAGEYNALVAREPDLSSLSQLSTRTFGRLEPAAAQVAYLQSYGFIDYIARRFGANTLRGLIRELIRTGDLTRSIRKNLRSDLRPLEQGFRSELSAAAR
jgi:hypothetical protein